MLAGLFPMSSSRGSACRSVASNPVFWWALFGHHFAHPGNRFPVPLLRAGVFGLWPSKIGRRPETMDFPSSERISTHWVWIAVLVAAIALVFSMIISGGGAGVRVPVY